MAESRTSAVPANSSDSKVAVLSLQHVGRDNDKGTLQKQVAPEGALEMNGCNVHIVRSQEPSALAWPALALVVVVGSATDGSDDGSPTGEGAVVVTVNVPPTRGNDGEVRPLTIVDDSSMLRQILESLTAILGDDDGANDGQARLSRVSADDGPEGTSNAEALLGRLSAKERQILRRLMDGMTAREIANDLSIAVSTARSHLQAMFQKLQVSNQLSAVVMAYKAGWSDDRALSSAATDD